MKYKIGDKVVVVSKDKHSERPWWCPSAGTVGTVDGFCNKNLKVRWHDKLLCKNGFVVSDTWYISEDLVEPYSEEESKG